MKGSDLRNVRPWVVRLGRFQRRSSQGSAGAGEEVRARGGARRRETWARGLRGEEDQWRAHEPRSGGSRDDGGDQSGPSRRGDFSRPDQPPKLSAAGEAHPEIFSEGGNDRQIFFKPICDGIFPQRREIIIIYFYQTMSDNVRKDRLFHTASSGMGMRHSITLKLNSRREEKRQRYLVVK